MPGCESNFHAPHLDGAFESYRAKPAGASSQLWCPPAVAHGGFEDVEDGAWAFVLKPATAAEVWSC